MPQQIAALRRASIVCVLGEPHPAGCPGPDRPESFSVFVGCHLVVRNALLGEPAAVNTRGVVGGRVGAGAGRGPWTRSTDRRCPRAPHSAGWPCPLTCVETWRSRGEAAWERWRPSPDTHWARRQPRHEAVRCRGCQHVSVCRTGDRGHPRRLPPLSPPQHVDKVRNLRQVPHSRPVSRERLNSHSPALSGATSQVANLPILLGICIIGGSMTRHD